MRAALPQRRSGTRRSRQWTRRLPPLVPFKPTTYIKVWPRLRVLARTVKYTHVQISRALNHMRSTWNKREHGDVTRGERPQYYAHLRSVNQVADRHKNHVRQSKALAIYS